MPFWGVRDLLGLHSTSGTVAPARDAAAWWLDASRNHPRHRNWQAQQVVHCANMRCLALPAGCCRVVPVARCTSLCVKLPVTAAVAERAWGRCRYGGVVMRPGVAAQADWFIMEIGALAAALA
jgi:hypothetical protein